MDKAEWQQQIRRINLAFPGQPLRPETAVAWFDEGDLEPHETWLVSLAVRRIIRTADYPPRSVAGLLRVVEEVRGEMAREQAEDATRTCPGCCTSDIAGWLEGDEGWHPCGDCHPGRHEAWSEMRRSRFSETASGRNWMVASFDKATGFPKARKEVTTPPQT